MAIATSKSSKPPSICVGEIGRADDVCAGLLRLLGLLALGEDGDANVLAGAVRKHERAAKLLLGVADVQAEAEVHLDGLVELRGLELLQHADRLERRVELLAVDRAARLAVLLPVLAHWSTSTPIERAVPATTSIAWLDVARVQVVAAWSRRSARTCSRVRRPDLVAVGLGRALLELQRLLDQDGSRRRLRDEGERAVLVDRDLDRGDPAVLLLRSAR